ncbi:MAG: tellurium resistance protein TerC, partial [Myxococcota bacterium]
VLLFVVIKLVEIFKDPFFSIHWTGVLEGGFNFSVLVFLLGGAFIMYTAVKEISHMMMIEDPEHAQKKEPKPAATVVALIVLMNLIFSFDSILSALAITEVLWVLATAITISAVMMLLLANQVSAFLKKNRKYEVLGLFILLIVGVVLLGEGGHEAHLKLFGYPVEPLSKTTFYFSVAVLVIVDLVQSRYQKKLRLTREAEAKAKALSKGA